MTGRAAGDTLQIDQGSNAETVKVASVDAAAVGTGAEHHAAPPRCTRSHLSGAAVYVPQIVDGKILQSQTLTPLRTDPRLRDAERHRQQRRRRLCARGA